MSPYRVSFHVGAHKTASTYLKQTIQANRAFLRRNGVRMLPSRRFRTEFVPLESLIENGASPFAVISEFRGKLNEFAADANRLLISEENTLALNEPFGEGGIYPRAAKRFLLYRTMMSDEPVDVFLSVRNYATFLPSLYGQYIRHNAYMSFDEFLVLAREHGYSWVGLIERILDQLWEGDTLTVWTYEAFERDPEPSFSAFTGLLDLTEFQILNDRPMQGLSRDAMAFVAKAMSTKRDGRAAAAIKSAQENFPINSENPKFDPFDEGLFAALSDEYEDGLIEIRSLLGTSLIS